VGRKKETKGRRVNNVLQLWHCDKCTTKFLLKIIRHDFNIITFLKYFDRLWCIREKYRILVALHVMFFISLDDIHCRKAYKQSIIGFKVMQFVMSIDERRHIKL